MYSRDQESNYRMGDPNQMNVTGTGTVNSGSGNPNGSNGGAYMSVAAKAGEMQIFSSDIFSQVNGLSRRQTQKQALRGGSKFSSLKNDKRHNQLSDHVNNAEEKMLQIDQNNMLPRQQSSGQHAEVQQLLSTLHSSQNDRNIPPMVVASLPRDSLPHKQKLQTIQNHNLQRLHPSQTFEEYMAHNGAGKAKKFVKGDAAPDIGGAGPLQFVHQQQQSHSEAPTMMAMSSNGHISNSSSAIGQPQTSYSGKEGMTSNEINISQISQKHLKIEVQSSQQQRRGFETTTNVDQTFTPTMIRRSIASHSASKQQERISFLDKAAAQQHAPQLEQTTFDVKNSMVIGNKPSTVTAKKIQAAKLAQQQLLQNRYTNGTEQHMLPKMAGISLDRKSLNISKHSVNTASLPPTGQSLSLIQQGHLRRRHGDLSRGGGQLDGGKNFGVSGESLQIKLTGTSLMNRNQQRDSYSQQVHKEGEISQSMQSMGVYHPKLRARIPDMPAQFSNIAEVHNVKKYNSVAINPSNGASNHQNQFAQQMAELQMNSPRNSNQIFQEQQAVHQRQYSYHYIYDYLFVQVTEKQYEKEYANRIRTFQKWLEQETESTPERPHQSDDYLQNNLQRIVTPQQLNSEERDGSPSTRARGPPLKLNQNQVFFSPQTNKDPQSKLLGIQEDSLTAHRQQTIENQPSQGRFRKSTVGEQINEYGGSEVQTGRSKVVKMKKNSMGFALEKSLQSTQFEGLKVLTKDSILHATKGSDFKKKEEELNSPPVPTLNLQENQEKEETVSNFMVNLGQWLQDQNQRFKVTIKKKYINDILMQSKGAQNLAQHVIMVITDNISMSLNSPNKRQRRAKRNLSVDVSSGDEDQEENGIIPTRKQTESQMRMHGQATPQVISSKAKANQIGRRGYESENENKSLNSTTTSSTFPNLNKAGYATRQQNTPRQPKMSTRSLSQIPNTVRIQRKITDDINAANIGMGSAEDALNSLGSKYPPTKIKIVQNVNKYNDHQDHPISKMLSDYNEFTRLVFRTRSSEAQAIQKIPYAIKLGKRLGMQLTKNQLMPATLKVRENSNAIKEKLIFHVIKVMQGQNEFNPQVDHTCQIFNKKISEHSIHQNEQKQEQLANWEFSKNQAFHYRCFVGKGNNQMMVRALFKNRFWWLFIEKEEPEKINFFWTQLRKLSIMNSLTCKLVNPKDKTQQKHLQSIAQQSPSQGLGMAIAQNSAMCTPTGASKVKRRKLSSATSKSPDAPSSLKQKMSTDNVESTQGTLSNIAMTLVGVKDTKGSDMSVGEESKQQDIPGVTAAPPQAPATQLSPNPPAKEESKKEAAAANNARAKPFDTYPSKLANKIEDNYHLCNKKALFVNMKNYYEAIGEDPFDSLPVTFHVKEGLDDPNFISFKQYYEEHKDANNIWITKPGECTNRGVGIQVAKEWHELEQIIQDSTRSSKKTCIVQKYIHNPLLIHRRKFDIRTFCMATSNNGNYKAYYYQEGYLRTSCREFTLQNLSNRMVHLTNDAIQKKAEDYGKYEPGNKMSYTEFQSYIDKNNGSHNVCYERDILPQIKKLTTDCFRASYGKMDPYKRFNTFECFGLDFMIDDNFKVFLIEVNTNPCLELSSPLLARLIPSMLENAIRLAVDPIFPPPEHFSQRKHIVHELCPENKFELIFDEKIDGPELNDIWREKDNVIIEIDEEELSDADIDGIKEAKANNAANNE